MSLNHIHNTNLTIVLHPPGVGGNHVTNILSLSPKFYHKFPVENYDTYLLQYYESLYRVPLESPIFHIGPFQNLQKTTFIPNRYLIETNKDKSYALSSHMNEFVFAYGDIDYNLKGLDPFIIILSRPTPNTLFYNRMIYGPWWHPKQDPSFYLNREANYNQETLFTLMEAHNVDNELLHDKCYELDSDKLYDPVTGPDYLKSALSDTLNLDLPDSAYKLHEIYIKIIDLVWSKRLDSDPEIC